MMLGGSSGCFEHGVGAVAAVPPGKRAGQSAGSMTWHQDRLGVAPPSVHFDIRPGWRARDCPVHLVSARSGPAPRGVRQLSGNRKPDCSEDGLIDRAVRGRCLLDLRREDPERALDPGPSARHRAADASVPDPAPARQSSLRANGGNPDFSGYRSARCRNGLDDRCVMG
jgi:hypothetical protein